MFKLENPDIARATRPTHQAALDSVGMQHIDLLLSLVDLPEQSLAVKANVSVNLPEPDIKGIHMSRLYQHVYHTALAQPLSPVAVEQLLYNLVISQQECGSTSAHLGLRSTVLLQRTALITDGLAGFKAYPVSINASLIGHSVSIKLTVDIGYSSTCPCSAALSRQLLSAHFRRSFAGKAAINVEQASTWLAEHGSLATPHSQRSVARISVNLSQQASHFGLVPLIELAEQALATPLQTAVKRADEQEFARLNGANLMFVEDAVRRLHASLRLHYQSFSVEVSHLESLHPHDAVASVSVNQDEQLI
ncbi:GTP cyclohydrolase FolE2 [Arsukibacterium sp.]|uniref:GTP cyclohydrolase FolE2 n=1 Tax=Arsukibacterium sp. TaxID=1977258 RepID=UPI002FDB047A